MYQFTNNIDDLKKNIFLKKIGNNISIINQNGKKIKLGIKNIVTPFGLESYSYNKNQKLFLKINLSHDQYITFRDFESDIGELVNNQYNLRLNIKSQLICKIKYSNQLILKFKEYKNKIQTKIYNLDKTEVSLYNIKPKNILNLELSPNIYIYGTEIIIKWSIITINILR